MTDHIEHRSLEELSGKWKSEIPKEGYSSSIQLRTYKLYGQKLNEYGHDDIRFMIGQQVGLPYLVPIALHILQEDLLVDACYYEGDLLHALLVAPKAFWQNHLNLYSALCRMLLANKERLSCLDPKYEADKKLMQDVDRFLTCCSTP